MATMTPAPQTNRLGLTLNDYKGAPSTLCAGCGHDAITMQIVRAFYEMGVEPHRVAKLSGIGCSSKAPAYYLSRSHGFNSVHGRMPAVATGTMLANRDLLAIGMSGDGDTASIGMGQFVHAVRRNIPMIYVIANNGVYGLTKGQLSATADVGSKLKSGVMNDLPPVDLCAMAIQLGCSYVARSFSGDPKQLMALLEGAIAHRGTAVLDIISPCMTFNNHEGSTKSYTAAKEHDVPLHNLDFIPSFAPLEIEVAPGESRVVELHDGSRISLRKLDRDYDPADRAAALSTLIQSSSKGEFLTGLLFHDREVPDLLTSLAMVDEPLATLGDARVRPSRETLEAIMERHR